MQASCADAGVVNGQHLDSPKAARLQALACAVLTSNTMVLMYRDGPYASQDDYLIPMPDRIPVCGGGGHYRRTAGTDITGRVIYEWVAITAPARPNELPAVASGR
jgi:hypothetical protein